MSSASDLSNLRLASVSASHRSIHIWDLGSDTESCINASEDNNIAIRAFAASPDSAEFVSGSACGRIDRWQMLSGARFNCLTIVDMCTVSPFGRNPATVPSVTHLAFYPDCSGRFAAGNADGSIYVFSTRAAAAEVISQPLLVLRNNDRNNPLVSVVISSDSRWIAYCGRLGVVWFCDASSGEVLHSITVCARSLAWFPDSLTIAAGLLNGTVALYNVPTQGRRRVLQVAGNTARLDSPVALRLEALAVNLVDVSPCGCFVAAVSANHLAIRIFKSETGVLLRALQFMTASSPLQQSFLLSRLVFSPDSKFVAASNCGVPSINVWSIARGSTVSSLDQGRHVLDLAFVNAVELPSLATATAANATEMTSAAGRHPREGY